MEHTNIWVNGMSNVYLRKMCNFAAWLEVCRHAKIAAESLDDSEEGNGIGMVQYVQFYCLKKNV